MPNFMLPLIALGILASIVHLALLSIVFEKLGLPQHLVYPLLAATVVGSLINLPVFEVASQVPPSQNSFQQLMQKRLRLPMPAFNGRTVVALNVGGALIPAGFAVYLINEIALDLREVISIVAIVASIAYLTSVPIRNIGIAMPFLVAPLTAALAAGLINNASAAPLAYIGGSLGVLIGADLLRLKEISALGSPVASIGGAGALDGIFLSGLLAVLLV